MFGIDPLFLVCSIILFIEIYNETFLMNYGSFTERVKYLFSLKMFFKIVKITTFTFIFYLTNKYYLNLPIFNNAFFESQIFSIDFDKLYIYLLPVGIYSIFLIMSNSVQILEQFSFDQFNKNRLVQFTAFLSFIIYRITAFIFTFFIFAFTYYLLIKLDNTFSINELTIFDWVNYVSKKNINYNTGVYFSLIITVLIFFLFNNAFIKLNSDSFDYRSIEISFFGYFFISIILSIGIFFGFFSIFNAIHNIQITSLTSWFSKENILGILPIRVASVMILFNLFQYIYSETLERKIIPFLILAFFPVRNIESYHLTINIEKRESLYFSQVSFYILNIAIAEYFVIIEFKNIYISILNFAILFIQDDFKIINDYSEGMQNVLKKHLQKIHFINLLMFISAVIILIINYSYSILTIYIVLTSILTYLYLYNYSFVNSRDYNL